VESCETTFVMKVLVQDPDTKRFYKSGGKWTEKVDEAAVFKDAIEATILCSAEQIDANLVVEFPDIQEKLEIRSGSTNWTSASFFST